MKYKDKIKKGVLLNEVNNELFQEYSNNDN